MREEEEREGCRVGIAAGEGFGDVPGVSPSTGEVVVVEIGEVTGVTDDCAEEASVGGEELAGDGTGEVGTSGAPGVGAPEGSEVLREIVGDPLGVPERGVEREGAEGSGRGSSGAPKPVTCMDMRMCLWIDITGGSSSTSVFNSLKRYDIFLCLLASFS